MDLPAHPLAMTVLMTPDTARMVQRQSMRDAATLAA